MTLHELFAPGVALADPPDRALQLVLSGADRARDRPAVCGSRTSSRRRAWSGASTPRIVRTHILPHLVGPIAVYFAIICAANIVLESAISFLNIGVPLPDASWGNMLRNELGPFLHRRPAGLSTGGIITSAWTTALPAAAIALTVLCLALIGEGVREAFDPGSRAKAVRL